MLSRLANNKFDPVGWALVAVFFGIFLGIFLGGNYIISYLFSHEVFHVDEAVISLVLILFFSIVLAYFVVRKISYYLYSRGW